MDLDIRMDHLLSHFIVEVEAPQENVFEKFYQLYTRSDMEPINYWLKIHFDNKIEKDEHAANLYRKEGNQWFSKKQYLKSIEFYTKSLRHAFPGMTYFALALANRSAALYEMKNYELCLKDLDRCLPMAGAMSVKPKLYMRKIKCYYWTGQVEKWKECIAEAYKYLTTEFIREREKYLQILRNLKDKQIKKPEDFEPVNTYELPELEDGENEQFANASSKIKMSYDAERGRHVVARKQIHKGDVLFVEKAFIFAFIFRNKWDLYPDKCYNCLRDVVTCVPCRFCNSCLYCDEFCGLESELNRCHRFECPGMQAGIWQDLGIALPALRALVRGLQTGLDTTITTPQEDLKNFGSRTDNYRYFNNLVSHLDGNEHLMSYMLWALVVVKYLEDYTEFFQYHLMKENCPVKHKASLIKLVGGQLVKHMAQLTYNASVIEHWSFVPNEIDSESTGRYPGCLRDCFIPDSVGSVASGIFPSVSMMNHSCRPNVTNFFIRDKIVVKALEDIPEGGEILNCYGIDYRALDRNQRQIACLETYRFVCKCEICEDPSKEIGVMDSFKCTKCQGALPKVPEGESMTPCNACHITFFTECLRIARIKAHRHFHMAQEDAANTLHWLMRCLKLRDKVLYRNHKEVEELYLAFFKYFLENNDPVNICKYFRLWLDIQKARKGENSRIVGEKLFETALAVLVCCIKTHPRNIGSLKTVLPDVERMIIEGKAILSLYYPDYIIRGLMEGMEAVSKKMP